VAIKRIDEAPCVTDQIIFDIITKDVQGCVDNPYAITKIVIYFLERGFSSNAADKQYDLNINNEAWLSKYAAVQAEYCLTPTEDLQNELLFIQNKLEMSKKTQVFYYKNAVSVDSFGDDLNSVWKYYNVNPGEGDPSLVSMYPILHINQDEQGHTQYGQFELQWTPLGMREGDYFICWSWIPYDNGTPLYDVVLSSHSEFNLNGNTQITTSIPTHFTKKDKYQTLLDRYLPEMFKNFIAADDLTPLVVAEFDNAVAQGFTILENLTNQMVDLIDSNATHESLLPWLGDFVGLKLRSQDPTLWRRQIKRAIPVYKKKGTLRGLTEALSQANIWLTNFSQLWQVVSPYTWRESFTYIDSFIFTLSKVCKNPDSLSGSLYYQDPNFELSYRLSNETTWTVIANAGSYSISDFFIVNTINGVTQLIWKSTNEHILVAGEEINIIYQTADYVDQVIENEIRNLPLEDLSDAKNGTYPLKNWNLKLIDENNPYFAQIITTRNPWHDFVIFGQIRTEFPYNENIYNAEEYNGSTRDSTNPCHIDKNFVDSCFGCLSSCYSVELEIEKLSNDRLTEAMEIIEEYTPFHSSLHTWGFSGTANDFVKSPMEAIQAYLNINGLQTVLTNASLIFNRNMENGTKPAHKGSGEGFMAVILREDVANKVVAATGTGIIKNANIRMFCVNSRLDNLPLYNMNESVLEILTGVYSVLSGLQISDPEGNTATVNISETGGLNTTTFTFRLSKKIYSYSNTSIIIRDPQEDGYKPNQAIVDVSTDSSLGDIRKLAKIGNYVYYNGNQYYISQFLGTHSFVIDDYTSGEASGQSIIIYNRLLDNQQGNLFYNGTILTTTINYESELPIVNGYNGSDPSITPVADNSLFKESYFIQIDSSLFAISDIDNEIIILNGPDVSWTLAGTTKDYTIFRYEQTQAILVPARIQPNLPAHNFGELDHRGLGRRGNDIIELDIVSNMALSNSFMPILEAANKNQVVDVTGIQESINFTIKRSDDE
jgi:hypothetical protein